MMSMMVMPGGPASRDLLVMWFVTVLSNDMRHALLLGSGAFLPRVRYIRLLNCVQMCRASFADPAGISAVARCRFASYVILARC